MAEEVPKPLLYRPPQAWYFWSAFGAALAIHLTAVALAQKHEAPVEVPPDIPTAVVEATLQATEEPTPPPEDIPLPEPPPPPDIKPEFVEERTPPPRPPPAAERPKFTPIKQSAMSMSQAKALAVNSPRPPYPYEARAKRITGSGVITATVDPASGNVTDASVTKSTGSSILDEAAVSAFRR